VAIKTPVEVRKGNKMTSVICFLIYVIGTEIRYGPMCRFDSPTWVGMVVIAIIPFVNIGVAVLVLIDCVVGLSLDIFRVFWSDNGV
jgi:hypothetical protein